jgi:hypothetical protein
MEQAIDWVVQKVSSWSCSVVSSVVVGVVAVVVVVE